MSIGQINDHIQRAATQVLMLLSDPCHNHTHPSGLDAIAIAAGQEHTCAITRGFVVMCWGRNTYGQLGIGSIVDQNMPAATGLGTIDLCAI